MKRPRIKIEKFKPNKQIVKQMNDMYDLYMGFAKGNDNYDEISVGNAISGLIKKIFQINDEKNQYKEQLRQMIETKSN